MRLEPQFTIVVLTRDEAKSIPRLLYLLEDFLDRGGEILVLDSGSTDRTVEIATRGGCRVVAVNDTFDDLLDSARAAEIEQRFAKGKEPLSVESGQRLFNFGAAREHAAQLAANSFVFQLDASDQLSAFDIDALNEWIGSKAVGRFEYEQAYGNVRLRIARFYDRRRYRWEGRVHEVLFPSPGSDVATPAATINCDPKQLFVHHVQNDKKRNYFAGLALQVLEHPEKPRWWHYLGRELFYDQHYQSALAVLEKHAAMETAWPPERSQTLCFMGSCYLALRKPDEAITCCRSAIDIDPARREPLLLLATAYSRKGELDSAVRCAREALTIPRTSAYPEMEANYTWRPHSLLYWNLFWARRRDEAREHWEI
jgi:tetratricopeptide (TPR) repeat protein